MTIKPHEKSILDFLKKTDSMVDSIVVIGVTPTTTTTSLTMTIRKKLVKMFLENPHRRILKTILHLQAFTSFILQQTLDMTKNEVYSTIRVLLGLGIIEKVKTMRGVGGPHVVIYLVSGGDESKILEASNLHMDLMPKAPVPSLEYYVDPAKIEIAIKRIEGGAFYGSYSKTDVINLSKELCGEYKRKLVQSVFSYFDEKNWERRP